MTKIVYNSCYGGFGLSSKAVMRYAELKGIKLYLHDERFCSIYTTIPQDEWDKLPTTLAKNLACFSERDIDRSDKILVQVIEELKEEANGEYADLRIVSLKKGTAYRITEYDGYETVETNHSVDWNIA